MSIFQNIFSFDYTWTCFYREVETVSNIFAWMMSSLDDQAYTDEENPTVYNRVVEMYHAGTDKASQVRIANGMVDPDSCLHCVVATIAFGLGINLPDVEYVFHWGASADIMSYWQEVGRCARYGRSGKAILYIFPKISGQAQGRRKVS